MYLFYKFKKAKIDKHKNFTSISSSVNYFSGLEKTKQNLSFQAGYSGTKLYIQPAGGEGRKIWDLRPAWAIQVPDQITFPL